ncbi:MAG TPA: DUF4389 domain-containing protein [Acidimicrobiales bacterium]|nr:DUF4389 domain-containing protein [Acidimicrobiales bacterium]
MAANPAFLAPLPVHLAVAEPGPRNRLTALIRLIMVIPQWIVLFFVHIAALVVVIIGWFAALFTGRLPQFAVDFLSGVVRWDIRVSAYFYFLTDRYPPFSLDQEPGYPIQIAIPEAGPLNRLAVLVRFFIAIPAYIVAGVAGSGLAVFSIGSWFMVVFTGRLPGPLFEVTRAVIRYQARLLSYFTMLTPEYPWGLFGDPEGSEVQSPGWAIRLSDTARGTMVALLVVGVVVEIFQRVGR